MDETLTIYIESIKKDITAYKNGKLKLKNYLQLLEELNEWLKEQEK